MTDESPAQAAARLSRLLDVERGALLDGDLDRLTGLGDEKAALVAALNDAPHAATPDLLPVQVKLQRNQALLDGAMEGIRGVAARMAAFRRIKRAFDTYDAQGQRQTIRGQVARRMEKRA